MVGKEAVPLPGSAVKTVNSVCGLDCLLQCGITPELAGCTESPAGTCSIVSEGGVVLQDSVGSKAIIPGLLLHFHRIIDLFHFNSDYFN